MLLQEIVYRVYKKTEPFQIQISHKRIAVIWWLWMLRINGTQKHKVLYILEINNNVI